METIGSICVSPRDLPRAAFKAKAYTIWAHGPLSLNTHGTFLEPLKAPRKGTLFGFSGPLGLGRVRASELQVSSCKASDPQHAGLSGQMVQGLGFRVAALDSKHYRNPKQGMASLCKSSTCKFLRVQVSLKP